MTASAVSAIGEVRDIEFPHLEGCAFFNAASFGPMPRRALVAAVELLRMRADDPARFATFDYGAATAGCRRSAAALIGADADEIALGNGTSYGLYLAATLLPQFCRARGRAIEDATIVVSDREFPANVLPWLGMERAGARVELVPTDEHRWPREDALVDRLRRGDVALLALSAVQFGSGYRADLPRIGHACRDAGAMFVVDAAQAAGALPIDVRASAIDVLACGGQKWLCAPHGSGFAYVRRELCQTLEPPLRGWLATTAADDVTNLLDYTAPLLPDARRFELGTWAVHDQLAMAASIDLLLELGIDRVEAHALDVLAPLYAWLDGNARARLASPPPGPSASAIVCIEIREPAAAFRRLADERVICSLREGLLRFSPHFYNTRAEMMHAVELLDRMT